MIFKFFNKKPAEKTEDLETAKNNGWISEEEMLKIMLERIEKRLKQIEKKSEKSLTKKRA